MTSEPLDDEEVESVRSFHPDGQCDHVYDGCREGQWVATLDAARAVPVLPAARAEVAEPLSAGGVIGRGMPVRAEVAEPTVIGGCCDRHPRTEVAEPGDGRTWHSDGDACTGLTCGNPEHGWNSDPAHRWPAVPAATAGREPLDALRDVDRLTIEQEDGIRAALLHSDGYVPYPHARVGAFIGALREAGLCLAALDTPDPERR